MHNRVSECYNLLLNLDARSMCYEMKIEDKKLEWQVANLHSSHKKSSASCL
jgi:hypothetical protein